MNNIPRHRPAAAILLAALMASLTGCQEPSADDRLHKAAEESMQRQAQQNETIAQQSHEVTQNTGQMIEAGGQARRDIIELQRELAESEATVRQELTDLQQELIRRDAQGREELAQERAHIDRQREQVEAERKRLAAWRERAPVIAAALTQLGLIVACLAPLALAAYVFHSLRKTEASDAAMTELLIGELAGPVPPLPSLPPAKKTSRAQALEHGKEQANSSGKM